MKLKPVSPTLWRRSHGESAWRSPASATAYAAFLSQASGERPVAVRIFQQFVGMGP